MSSVSLFSGDADYSAVCAGTGVSLYVDDPPARVGQLHGSGGGGNDGAWLAYLEFDTSALVSATTALLRIVIGENHADSGQSISYNDVTVLAAPFDFGATVEPADWLDTAALGGLSPSGSITSVGPGPGDTVDLNISAGDVNLGGITRLVLWTNHQESATPAEFGANTQDEWWSLDSVSLIVDGGGPVDPPVDPPLAAPCVRATVGAWVADGETPDANGIVYTVEAADGWYSPATRSATMEAQPRGEAITVAQELGRHVTLTVVAHNPGGQIGLGAPAAFASMEAIKAAFRAVFAPVVLSIVDPQELPLAARVRRVGPIKQQIVGASSAVRFSIPLLAESPTLGDPPAGAPLTDQFDQMDTGVPIPEGSTAFGWVTVFDGGGPGVIPALDGPLSILTLEPDTATSPPVTHAALARSSRSFGDLDLTLDMRTTAQLRTGSAPNAWEMAWALWHYTNNTHFYYVVLKANGWEIGKADPAYPGAQRFLATGASPTYAVGTRYTVHIEQTGSTFTVAVDGTPLATFTDLERPYRSGYIGLYTEDAAVDFSTILAS